MKHLEKFLKLIIIGVLTALVRTYVQGFIPFTMETDMWQSIFVKGGIVKVAYLVFGSIFYTFMAALFLMFYKKVKGNRLVKGLKFSLFLLMIWVPFLWEPLPHVTLMDKVYYSLADAAALLFMGVLAGVFVAEGKGSKERKGKMVKSNVKEEPLKLEESKVVVKEIKVSQGEMKKESSVNTEEDPFKAVTVSSAYAGIKKGYPAKKQGSGKKNSKGRKKSKSQKAAAKKKSAVISVEQKQISVAQRSAVNMQRASSKQRTKQAKIVEKNVAADVATVNNKKVLSKKKAMVQTKNKFSVLNVLIIGLIFFLVRMGMYKFFRVYSFYGTNAADTMVWGLVTGLTIGVVYELICPLINTTTTYLKSIIFSVVFLAINLIVFNGFKSLIYSLDMMDLFMRTTGDVVAVLLGGLFCVLFDGKKAK